MDFVKAILMGIIAGVVLALVITCLGGCAQRECYSIQGIADGTAVAVVFNACTGKFELSPIPGMKVEPDPVNSTPRKEPPRQPGI